MTGLPTVSVVINTFNRADVLGRALRGLEWISYSPGFEVIVVNGPSTDATAQLLEKWRGRIKIGSCPVPNLSVSRNIGIAMAEGDVVAFIDDDAIPEAEWLEQLVVPFEDDTVAITGGHVYDHTGVTFQYRYGTVDRLGGNADPLQEWDPYKLAFPQTSRFPHPIGTNSAFRRSALLEIGGFDEEYEYFLDETDLVIRLIDAGWMIRQLSRAYVHHKFAPSSMRGENRVPKHRYSIIKNHVYFGLIHGREHYSSEYLEDEQKRYIDGERTSVNNAIEHGLLTAQDLQQYELDAARGLADGTERASETRRKLLDPDLPRRLGGPFLPFQTKTHGPVKRLIATSDRPTTEDERAALRRTAEDGWVVHLIEPAGRLHTVDFDDGIWIDLLGAEAVDSSRKSWTELLQSEIIRLTSSREVELIVDVGSLQAALRNFAAATSGAQSSAHRA